MRISVSDKYLELVRNDAKYFAEWLRWSGTEVTVLTMAPPFAEAALREALALGADRLGTSRLVKIAREMEAGK